MYAVSATLFFFFANSWLSSQTLSIITLIVNFLSNYLSQSFNFLKLFLAIYRWRNITYAGRAVLHWL